MPAFAAPPTPDAAAWPATAAALRAALQDEQAAYAYYSAALAAFGSYAPWPALHQACGQRIQSLAAALAALGQPAGIAPMTAPIAPPRLGAGWRASIERAMNGCIASAGLYQRLQMAPVSSAAARLFQRAQSDLLTRHLPALQRAWQAAADLERYHALQGIAPAQAHTRHGLIGDTVEQLLALLSRQGGLFGLAGALLRAAHPALLAGAFTGSAAVQGMRHARTPAHPPQPHNQEN